jgi:hypothetical protein
MRYVPHRFGNVEFADDCVQESLIALHEARHTFLPGRPIRPWVFAIVRNQAIDIAAASNVGGDCLPPISTNWRHRCLTRDQMNLRMIGTKWQDGCSRPFRLSSSRRWCTRS